MFDATNTASNTAGGQRFDQAVGLDYTKKVLSDVSTFTWNIFNQRTVADRRPIGAITLVVEDIGGVAFSSGSDIHLSAQYVGGYSGDVKTESSWLRYSALFLDYCDSVKPGFVALLNAKMKDAGYSDLYFVQITGKSVRQLWQNYKAKYRA
ncbi:hypothetical protein QOZ80_2AG0112080 [Eleusine coracana subsp. coracana]|nr:hypothetical protein QOZ80_2AG0112080 [Eleusine coracana subsp. coracana]